MEIRLTDSNTNYINLDRQRTRSKLTAQNDSERGAVSNWPLWMASHLPFLVPREQASSDGINTGCRGLQTWRICLPGFHP